MLLSTEQIPSARSNKTITAMAVLLMLSWSPIQGNAQKSTAVVQTEVSAAELQSVVAGLWRTDGSFHSTLHMRNVENSEITVSPTLYMADGTPFALHPIRISANAVLNVEINDALKATPNDTRAHLSEFGSLGLQYQSKFPDMIVAAIDMLDIDRSLVFSGRCASPGVGPKQLQKLDGAWWKRTNDVTGFVVFSNTTAESISLAYQVIGSGGKLLAPQALSLPAHNTHILNLMSMIADLPVAESRQGGIRIEYFGSPDAVLVTGGMQQAAQGYSATMPFRSAEFAQQKNSSSYAAVGVMTGKPMPSMGFPTETSFSPYAVLRNTTDKPLTVVPRLYWMDEAQHSRTVTLPTVHLSPRNTLQLEGNGLLIDKGLQALNTDLTMTFSYSGHYPDLQVAAGSVDQTGSYVFDVIPQGVAPTAGRGVWYWSIADGFDTMISLWNPADEAEDLMVTLVFSNGTGRYQFPLHLAGKASTMLSMAEIVAAAPRPDAEGNVIPPNVMNGSAAITSPQPRGRVNLNLSVGVFNTRTATCSSFCVTCDGAIGVSVSPSSWSIPKGSNVQLTATETWEDGLNSTFSYYNVTSASSWTSSSPSVATVAGGLVTGASAGTSTITATFNDLRYHVGSNNCDYVCPEIYQNFSGSSSGSVVPTITNVSPAQGLIGTTISGITLTGAGFGTTPTVNAGTGITVTYGSRSDTSITANFAVATNAPAGNHSVTVTANGQTSAAKTFYVQVPSKLSISSTGSLITITDGNVVGYYGNILKTHRCGVYRNVVSALRDQQGGTILGGDFTLTESFSNYSTTLIPNPGPPPTQSFDENTSIQVLADTQFFGFVAPGCPASNEHEAFDQSFGITIGSTSFPLSTVYHVERGKYSGTYKVDVTVKTP